RSSIIICYATCIYVLFILLVLQYSTAFVFIVTATSEIYTLSLHDALPICGILNISIPSRRDDLKIREDITEEVARIYGYDALPSSLPEYSIVTPGKLTDEQKKVRIIRHQLEALGLSQAINYALTSREKSKQFTDRTEGLELLMPMSEDHAVLRNSMIPHLI